MPLNEPICAACQKNFEIFPEDRVFYEKFGVPEPKNCPDCRLIRRLLERNAKHLYYRTCSKTGERMLSQYHAEQPFPVYSPKAWWSDNFEATEYGQDFDFSRPFFEQFRELKMRVPHLALFNTEGTTENSDYNNCTAYLKNCYLIAESDYCEDCYYSNLLKKCTNVVDCSVCYENELCYECVDCQGCQRLLYSQDSQNCSDGFFLYNCASCRDCIGCINQRHKQYMMFNKQYSKEEFERLKKEMRLETQEGVAALAQKCNGFFLTQPHKAAIAEQNENSYGDHLFNSKNAYFCFDSKDLEDCRYCQKLSLGVKTSMDYNSWGNKSELMYQCAGTGDNCYRCLFCVMCQTNMQDCTYCYECFSCSDCFGCVGIKKKQYCILNKQYERSEYEKLHDKIIESMKKDGSWGEFFPIEVCPFAYNESIAMDAFPITKEQALAACFRWRDEEQPKIVPGALFCACGRSFKIIPQEVKFYQLLNIPNPEFCPDCRHKNRMARRNPLKQWERACAQCQGKVFTSYAPQRQEKIVCEKCFLSLVY